MIFISAINVLSLGSVVVVAAGPNRFDMNPSVVPVDVSMIKGYRHLDKRRLKIP